MKKCIVLSLIIVIAFLLAACGKQVYYEPAAVIDDEYVTTAISDYDHPDYGYDPIYDSDYDNSEPEQEPEPEPEPKPEPKQEPEPELESEPQPELEPQPDPTPTAERVDNIEISIRTPGGMRTGTFSGYLIDGVPKGQGVFSTVSPTGNAWTYTGEFYNGLFNGYGITQWASGQRREGYFRDGYIFNGRSYNDAGEFAYATVDGRRVRP